MTDNGIPYIFFTKNKQINKKQLVQYLSSKLLKKDKIKNIKELKSEIKKEFKYKPSYDIYNAIFDIEDLLERFEIKNLKITREINDISKMLETYELKNKNNSIKYLHFKKTKKALGKINLNILGME